MMHRELSAFIAVTLCCTCWDLSSFRNFCRPDLVYGAHSKVTDVMSWGCFWNVAVSVAPKHVALYLSAVKRADGPSSSVKLDSLIGMPMQVAASVNALMPA